MTKSACVRVRVVRIALLGATAFGLLAAPLAIGEAAAKVGVTSATDGGPNNYNAIGAFVGTR